MRPDVARVAIDGRKWIASRFNPNLLSETLIGNIVEGTEINSTREIFVLLGANQIAVVNSSKSRQVQQYSSSLQQLSCVIHKNSTALMKIYGIDTRKNMEFGIFNIDYMTAASEAGLDITGCNT